MQWNSSNPDTSGTREKVSILVRCPCTTGVELHATTVLGGGCPCWRGVLIRPTPFWRLLSSLYYIVVVSIYLPSHGCTSNSWDTHTNHIKTNFAPTTNFTAHTQASFDNPGNTNYVIPIKKWAAEYTCWNTVNSCQRCHGNSSVSLPLPLSGDYFIPCPPLSRPSYKTDVLKKHSQGVHANIDHRKVREIFKSLTLLLSGIIILPFFPLALVQMS